MRTSLRQQHRTPQSIIIRKSVNIVLGNINYSARTYGAQKRGIYNADALREELLEILELTERAEKS